MKKKLATTLLAGALSASMVIPAFATNQDGVSPADTGTEVWAGIIIQDKNPIVKVEVPTLFAFVVNGTTDTTDPTSVTSTNGNIYLPNVKVDVTTPSSGGTGGEYNLTYTSDGVMRMNNYSTYEEEDTTGTTPVRKGLKLTINGEIRETSTVAANKNYWEYDTTAVAGVRDDFKKYWISIEDENGDVIGLTDATANGYKMTSDIELAAPDTLYDGTNYSNLDSVTNLAVNPTTHVTKFDVTVGGQRGQYNQVEQSAKIGTIVWTVAADVSLDNVDTAPDNDYLAIDPTDVDQNTIPTAP